MEIGDKVKILPCDEDHNINSDYKGRIGIIVKQYDNLINVRFNDGTVEAFWSDEIEIVQ